MIINDSVEHFQVMIVIMENAKTEEGRLSSQPIMMSQAKYSCPGQDCGVSTTLASKVQVAVGSPTKDSMSENLR